MPKAKQQEESLIEEAGQGHNSISKQELEQLLLSIEALLAERKNISDDIRAAMDVADQKGFDKRTLREMIKLRALDQTDREERESLRDVYLAALGLV